MKKENAIGRSRAAAAAALLVPLLALLTVCSYRPPTSAHLTISRFDHSSTLKHHDGGVPLTPGRRSRGAAFGEDGRWTAATRSEEEVLQPPLMLIVCP